MTGIPAPPRLTGGQVTVTRREQLIVSCPKCSRSIDITGLAVGTTIECSSCSNVTWSPEYVPRWWHRTRMFVFSLIVAYLVGVGSSMTASYLFNRMQSNPGATSAQPRSD
jgi:hypothetical protein